MRHLPLEDVAKLILCYDNDDKVAVYMRGIEEDPAWTDDDGFDHPATPQVEIEVRLKLADDSADGLLAVIQTGPAELAAVTFAVERACEHLKRARDARA